MLTSLEGGNSITLVPNDPDANASKVDSDINTKTDGDASDPASGTEGNANSFNTDGEAGGFDGKGTVINKDGILNQNDIDRLAKIRNDLNITSNGQLKRNVAFGEGHIDGVDIGEIIGVSGQKGPGVDLPSDRIFNTTVDGFPRDFDSEVFVLENLAQRLSPNSKGVINLISERAPCKSCTGVIDQFRKMFPNIKLNIRGGT